MIITFERNRRAPTLLMLKSLGIVGGQFARAADILTKINGNQLNALRLKAKFVRFTPITLLKPSKAKQQFIGVNRSTNDSEATTAQRRLPVSKKHWSCVVDTGMTQRIQT